MDINYSMKTKLLKQFYYRVKIDDTLDEIYSRFNTSKENVLRNNDDIPLYPGEWIRITQNDYITHIVKPTETLEQIAIKYNIDILEIKQKNNLTSDKLFIGQILKI